MHTINEHCMADIVEKKSKFICNLYNIETIEDAEKKIQFVKKEYHDARHNCYAYVIYDEINNSLITKVSDDGEPSGTAGSPILNALKSNDMVNTLAIVTRYFGGILLGTGGLVRAYKQATINAIEQTTLYKVENGYLVNIEISYNDNEKFKYFCKKNNIDILKIEYLNNIKYIIEINDENKNILEDKFKHKIISFDIVRQKMIKTV